MPTLVLGLRPKVIELPQVASQTPEKLLILEESRDRSEDRICIAIGLVCACIYDTTYPGLCRPASEVPFLRLT